MDGGALLEGCSPWGLEESDTTERLHFHFSLSCIGEGNGNPFQSSCLHSSKASILQHSAFFTVQLSHPSMTTGKTIALTRRTFAGKVMSLLLNMLSRLVITFLPRSKRLLISWLQSPSAVILEPKLVLVYNRKAKITQKTKFTYVYLAF